MGIPATLDIDGEGALKFISESFDGLELPEPLLRSPNVDNSLNVVNITNPMPKSVVRGIPYQSNTIKEEFFNLLLGIFSIMNEINVNSLTLDLEIDASTLETSKKEQMILFLKTLGAHLYRHNIKVRLPLRIPAPPDGKISSIPSLIRKSMCGMFRIELNVHPHEMLNESPLEHIHPYRFLADSISFVYEPEAGNFLVDKLLEPWLKALNEIDFQGDVIFKPMVSTWDNLDNAVDGLHPLLNR